MILFTSFNLTNVKAPHQAFKSRGGLYRSTTDLTVVSEKAKVYPVCKFLLD